MKILPPGMPFEQALRAGLTGRIECERYLKWIRTLPCDTCGNAAPSQASHINSYKGMGTKSPDYWAIPQCPSCHELYERGPGASGYDPKGRVWLERVALYLLEAIYEGRLVWHA